MAQTSTIPVQTEQDLSAQMTALGQAAREAARTLGSASTEQKNQALEEAARALLAQEEALLVANQADVAQAKANNITGAFLDRLVLNPARIQAMAKGLQAIAVLPDPVGRVLANWQNPAQKNGLSIARVSVPLGVIGIIYESRPNVTADAGALCLKAGNAAILRGGSESAHSSGAILDCLRQGLAAAGLPEAAIAAVPTQDREAVGALLRMDRYVDVIIPRGGKGLIRRIIEESRIPTLQHLDGNCHTYIHASADADKAVSLVVNAKLRRVGICGATESLVMDRAVAPALLPALLTGLEEAGGCEVRGEAEAVALDSRIQPAGADDFDMEYLDAILSVKLVDDVREAIAFINAHSSHHTDAIVAEDHAAAEQFLTQIDSAIVMHNTSTQFADGGEFGMGAEIGIATGRLHARGPVGLEQLTTFKYQVRGQGQIRPVG